MKIVADRQKLPDRRYQETFNFTVEDGRYIASVGFFDDGRPAELFLNSSQKAGSTADINACDAAVAVSIAFQYGVPIDILRHAMKRNADGSPQGPLGKALDLIAEGKK